MINREQLEQIRSRIASNQQVSKVAKQSKYKNKQQIVDGIKFPSQLEANEYKKLKLLKQVGEIKWFTMQVPFVLPGGIRYRADFLVQWSDGKVEIIETKGMMTDCSRIKLKQMTELFPDVPIRLVKS